MDLYANMRDRRREMERRQISIEMMNEHYDDMGVRIMMWPHLCYVPDRDPDAEDDDMPQWLHIRYFRQV